jgi:nucleotide-binding universal stress UspA family protein
MPKSIARVDRILCAVTFSPTSRRIVDWAASLAQPYEGEVRLFHALSISHERAFAASKADSERVLKKLSALAQHLPRRPRISAGVSQGDAVTEILRHARVAQADLIAIGMHAQDGSVSPLIARLANEAPCPVLVVDETTTPARESGGLAHILIAVNFVPASLAAADYGLSLAHTAGARVTVVHVLPEHWDGPQRHDANLDETLGLIEHHFRQLLQISIGEVSGLSGRRSTLVTSGRPCVEIVRLARSHDADLIVMGVDASLASHEGRGETTDCVMQFARRTVLLVPERLFRERRAGRGIRGKRPH